MSHELIYHVTLFAGMEANLACPVKLSLILFNRGLPSSIPKDSAAYLTGVNNAPKVYFIDPYDFFVLMFFWR